MNPFLLINLWRKFLICERNGFIFINFGFSLILLGVRGVSTLLSYRGRGGVMYWRYKGGWFNWLLEEGPSFSINIKRDCGFYLSLSKESLTISSMYGLVWKYQEFRWECLFCDFTSYTFTCCTLPFVEVALFVDTNLWFLSSSNSWRINIQCLVSLLKGRCRLSFLQIIN